MKNISVHEAANAAGCSPNDLKNWVKRNLLNLPIDPAQHGKPRYYSIANVYELRLLRALNGIGIEYEAAKGIIRGRLGEILRNRSKEASEIDFRKRGWSRDFSLFIEAPAFWFKGSEFDASAPMQDGKPHPVWGFFLGSEGDPLDHIFHLGRVTRKRKNNETAQDYDRRIAQEEADANSETLAFFYQYEDFAKIDVTRHVQAINRAIFGRDTLTTTQAAWAGETD